MNCERFQTIAGDLDRKGSGGSGGSGGGVPAVGVALDASDRADALAHAGNCEHCGQLFADQNDLSEKLRSVAERMKFVQAPSRVEERLLATFRDQTRVRSPRPHWGYWLGAVAAALLVSFGLLIWRMHVASTRTSPAEAHSNSAIAPAPEAPKQEQPLSVKIAGNQSNNVAPIKVSAQSTNAPAPETLRRRRHPTSLELAKRTIKPSIVEQAPAIAANVESKEIVTEFVSVGYGSALDLQDGGQLVRVELPRSALARFGLPVNMNRVDEKVKADVLVGADGMARAIRFVQ